MSIYADETEQIRAVAEGESRWMTSLEVEDGAVEAVKPPTEPKAADGLAFKHCVAASGRNQCFRARDATPTGCIDQFPTATESYRDRAGFNRADGSDAAAPGTA